MRSPTMQVRCPIASTTTQWSKKWHRASIPKSGANGGISGTTTVNGSKSPLPIAEQSPNGLLGFATGHRLIHSYCRKTGAVDCVFTGTFDCPAGHAYARLSLPSETTKILAVKRAEENSTQTRSQSAKEKRTRKTKAKTTHTQNKL